MTGARTASRSRVALVVTLVACAALASCRDDSAPAKAAASAELDRVGVPTSWSAQTVSFAKGADRLWSMERDFASTDPDANFVTDLKGPVVKAGWQQQWCGEDGNSCHFSRNGHVLWIIQEQGPKADCPDGMSTCSLGTMRLEL